MDEIESIKAAAQQKSLFKIQNKNGKYLNLKVNEIKLKKSFLKANNDFQFELLDVGKGKVAIKTSNESLLNFNNKLGIITADGSEINDNTSFDLIPIIANQFMFRCSNGNFFSTNKSTLLATERYMKGAGIFYISSLSVENKKKEGVVKKLKLLKKRLLYIKSKVFHG